MEAICWARDLESALDRAGRADDGGPGSRSPTRGMALIEARDGAIRVSGVDNGLAITAKIPGTIRTAGDAVIPGDASGKLTRLMGDASVRVALIHNEVRLSGRGISAVLKTRDPQAFPPRILARTCGEVSATTPTDSLCWAIANAAAGTAGKRSPDSRAGWAQMDVGPDSVVLITNAGFRGAVVTVPATNEAEEHTTSVVSMGALQQAGLALARSGGLVEVRVVPQTGRVELETQETWCALQCRADGQRVPRPDGEWQGTGETVWSVSAERFRRSIEVGDSLGRDAGGATRLALETSADGDRTLTVTVTHDQVGRVRERVELERAEGPDCACEIDAGMLRRLGTLAAGSDITFTVPAVALPIEVRTARDAAESRHIIARRR